jgi:hypothetical protein
MYSIEDLSLMPFTSDKDLQGFLNKWDEILACIDIAKLEGPVLAQMFQKKLLNSQVMKTEVNHWRRLKVGHEDRTYEWLRDSVETHLRLEKEDRNQDTLQHAHRSGAKNKPAAPGKGKGKDGGKDKDKDKKKREGKGEGKGKGKGKGGGKSGASTPGQRKPAHLVPCRFLYGFGSCNKQGDGCEFAHRQPTKDEIREYGLFKQGDKPPDAKAKGKGKGRCEPFFSTGNCRYGDKCIFSHSDKDKAKPKAKAKAKGKGRGKRAAPATEWDGEEEEEWPEDE